MLKSLIFGKSCMAYSHNLENRKMFQNFTKTLHKFSNKTTNIYSENCNLSIVLTATDQKQQKSFKRWYYSASASRWHSGDVMVCSITFLMIFAVFDLSSLTPWINCSASSALEVLGAVLYKSTHFTALIYRCLCLDWHIRCLQMLVASLSRPTVSYHGWPATSAGWATFHWPTLSHIAAQYWITVVWNQSWIVVSFWAWQQCWTLTVMSVPSDLARGTRHVLAVSYQHRHSCRPYWLPGLNLASQAQSRTNEVAVHLVWTVNSSCNWTRTSRGHRQSVTQYCKW